LAITHGIFFTPFEIIFLGIKVKRPKLANKA